MMVKKVFPAIQKAFKGTGVKAVVVQHDGARPHTGKGNMEKLNAAGAKLKIKIEVRTQPAQSPDLNINDLAFFRSLSISVRKARRLSSQKFDVERLCQDVLASFEDYPGEKLEEMWEYKRWVMSQIVACDGGNDYKRHRAR